MYSAEWVRLWRKGAIVFCQVPEWGSWCTEGLSARARAWFSYVLRSATLGDFFLELDLGIARCFVAAIAPELLDELEDVDIIVGVILYVLGAAIVRDCTSYQNLRGVPCSLLTFCLVRKF